MRAKIGHAVAVVLAERGRRNEKLLERVLAGIENLASADRNTDSVSVSSSDAQVPLHVTAHPVEKLDCGS